MQWGNVGNVSCGCVDWRGDLREFKRGKGRRGVFYEGWDDWSDWWRGFEDDCGGIVCWEV
uniref:hypothetical protein n=1 Tax=Bacillus pumilus TaxID=1408 RepID=UPI001C92DCAF